MIADVRVPGYGVRSTPSEQGISTCIIARASGLHLQLGAQLDHSVRWDREVFGSGSGVSRHEDVELLAPPCERRPAGWQQPLAPEEVRRITTVRDNAHRSAAPQNLRDVCPLHEAELRDYPPEAFAEV